ncbi:hypothetical protein BH10BAC5_BH10BAC5_01650 [soil metagenome]
MGRQSKRITPDAGTTLYSYDINNNLLLSQDEKQRSIANNVYTWRTYDGLNRLITIRETPAGNSYPDFENATESALESTGSDNDIRTINVYDSLYSASYTIFSNQPSDYYSAKNNTKGGLVCTAFRTVNGATWNYKFYRYDARGRVIRYWTYLSELGTWKIENYEYNSQNQVTVNHYQASVSDSISLVNNYDVLARLSSVTRSGVQLAGYQYNRNSQDSVSSLMPNMPTTKYFYNTRNWLTLLQSSNSGNTFFREGLYYNPNGNIYSQYMDGSYNDNFSLTQNLYYNYTYDKSNRLLKSDATFEHNDIENMYDLLMSYDGDGNFQSMTRTGSDKDHSDLFVYEYATGTNKLMQIRGASEYDYDQNGNMIRDDINHTWNMQYDFRNLLLSLKSQKPNLDKPEEGDIIFYTEYAYDEAGNRISKKVWKYHGTDPDPVIELESPGTWSLETNDFYIRNTSGAEVAVYNSTAIQFWNIWGIDNVGRINADTTKQFYLKDHLGSIRCVLNSASTIISSQDMDAWGHEMEGRKYDAGSSSSKYLFTSKERDSESDYDYFGARYYDSRIGRWGGVEPLLDKYIQVTPYNYANNNPLITFDYNGQDWGLAIWLPKGDEVGHIGIFISNYDDDNKQKNNDYHYTDLWPKFGSNLNQSSYMNDFPADYGNKEISIEDLESNLFLDQETRVPDGILIIQSDYATDKRIVSALLMYQQSYPYFNLLSNNCSNLVKAGIEAGTGQEIDSKETVMGHTLNSPLKLFRAFMNDKKAELKKDPGANINKSYESSLNRPTIWQKLESIIHK